MAEKTLSVKLSLNDRQFQSALRKSTRSIQRFGNKMQSFGDTMTRNITLPVIGLGAAAVKLASDFEETQSKFNTVFRDIREQANLTAKNLANDFGLSSRASMQLLSDTGDLLTGFGFTQEEALKLSNEVNKLAVDLASFTNFSGGAEGASLALTKALLGERESIKSLGIAITEADLKQFAADQGLVFKELGRVEKANLTFQLAINQSANAVGDFARTSDSFANQLRILKGELENVAVELGVELLPIAKSLVVGLRDLTKFTSQFSEEQKKGALQVAGFAAALGPIISIGGRLVKAFASLRKFFLGKFLPALRLVAKVLMNLTPQGRIISGLILAASYLVTNWGKVKKGFDDLVDSTTTLLEKLGLLKKEEDLGLDFSIQQGEVLSVEELRRRTAAFKGTKIVQGKKPVQMSQEEREGRAEMAKGKADTLNLPSIEPIKAVGVELDKIPEKLDTIDVKFENSFTKMEQMAIMVSSTIRNAFLSTADASEQSSKDIIKSAKNAAREQIKIALATAVAEQMKSIFANVPFPFNLALAAAAGSIVGSLFAKVIPAFANGGMVTGATLAMVGEGPGTSMSNPEVIAPLDKLKSMIGMNGGGAVQVFGTISGQDILLSSDRARNNRNRTRGY